MVMGTHAEVRAMRHRLPRLGFILLLAVTAVSIGTLAVKSPVVADPNESRVFVSPLEGAQEVPPRDTHAVGVAVYTLDANETQLGFRLNVANIDNVVMAHIHLAERGVNGPIVAFLYGPVSPAGGPSNGVLSTGTITAANLVGPLAGQPLSSLIEAMRIGGAYTNVHTNDGVDPQNTGPGDFPGGEIRGQISEKGPS